jgi:hypothetical protein
MLLADLDFSACTGHGVAAQTFFTDKAFRSYLAPCTNVFSVQPASHRLKIFSVNFRLICSSLSNPSALYYIYFL